MEIVYAIGTVLRIALRVYVLLLWARLILDWVILLSRGRFRPRGVLAVLVEFDYTLTDPPIRMFRRVLPPIRLGPVALDLGWLITMACCLILLALIPGWW